MNKETSETRLARILRRCTFDEVNTALSEFILDYMQTVSISTFQAKIYKNKWDAVLLSKGWIEEEYSAEWNLRNPKTDHSYDSF